MNQNNLAKYIADHTHTDENELETLLSHCSTMQVKKGEFLLREGEKCMHSFFVENGLLRQYYLDDSGKEYIVQFAPENWFMSDRESVYFDLPTHYFIQALEDTSVFLFEESLIMHLSIANPRFIEFNNRLLHNHIRHLQRRITLLMSATAEQRYLEFIQIYPDLINRVSQISIASYLGITPESLSRVRKEILSKHQK